jgi:PPM family protein phosphatase
MEVRVGAATHVGRVRAHNEDCLYVNGWIAQASGSELSSSYPLDGSPVTLAVIDGMGGHVGGALASATAGLALADERLDDLAIALENVSRAVMKRGQEVSGHADMGATIAGLVLDADEIVAFNLGDSRIYRYAAGYLSEVSVDDLAPDPSGMRKGLISQALGKGTSQHTIDPHTLRITLKEGGTFLLCSDGLHDCVAAEAIGANLELPPDVAAPALIKAALDAGAPDNVSVVVARVS